MMFLRRSLLLFSLIAMGCRPSREPDWSVEKFRSLPGLRGTHHPGLIDEHARLIDDRVALEQLAKPYLLPSENAAVRILDLLPRNARTRLQNRTRSLLGAKSYEPIQPAEVRRLRNDYEELLYVIADACTLPDCQFPDDVERGELTDYSWYETWESVIRLLQLVAQSHVADEAPDAAIESLLQALQLTDYLARVPHLLTRVRAAQLRMDLLDAASSALDHEGLTQNCIHEFSLRLNAWLADWPADEKAWSGERDWGLLVYELARAGHLSSLLSERETLSLNADGQLLSHLDDVVRKIDDDEFYYLSTLRKLIDACRRPPAEREQVLLKIRSKLDDLHASGNSDRLVARMLLADFDRAHAWQVTDRARCERMAQGLHLRQIHDTRVAR